jgi:hypothetical protein
MVGELVQMRLEVFRVQPLERVTNAAVQLNAPPRAEIVVERVPDQHMGEAQATRLARHVGDDTLPSSLVEDLEELIAADLADVFERGEVELATEHRSELEDELAVVREAP